MRFPEIALPDFGVGTEGLSRENWRDADERSCGLHLVER